MKRLEMRILVSAFAAMGWWGLLYPQLAMTPDTYEIVYENEAAMEKNMEEWNFDSDIYRQILEAEDGQVHLRSKLFMRISAFIERGSESNGSGE